MILKEILEKLTTGKQITLPIDIECRVTTPDGCDGDDVLSGYCRWDGETLEPLDSDSYYPDEEILSYRIRETESGEPVLVIVAHADWCTGTEWDAYIDHIRGHAD